jgi:hypothetical protein
LRSFVSLTQWSTVCGLAGIGMRKIYIAHRTVPHFQGFEFSNFFATFSFALGHLGFLGRTHVVVNHVFHIQSRPCRLAMMPRDSLMACSTRYAISQP